MADASIIQPDIKPKKCYTSIKIDTPLKQKEKCSNKIKCQKKMIEEIKIPPKIEFKEIHYNNTI